MSAVIRCFAFQNKIFSVMSQLISRKIFRRKIESDKGKKRLG
jgi:hypothetical protein